MLAIVGGVVIGVVSGLAGAVVGARVGWITGAREVLDQIERCMPVVDDELPPRSQALAGFPVGDPNDDGWHDE